MKINLKDLIEILLAAIAIGTLIYRMSEARAHLERKIDLLERKLDLHVAKVEGKDEFSDYIVHGLDEKIDHKFQRLWDMVQEIQRFLEKRLEYTIRKH
ncbi:MAG: hypothetical protein QNJ36_03225 [Calothrix sp. MO_167.B42]|nr:hypothetical protein [Calothrix sp. MO_167.B42]